MISKLIRHPLLKSSLIYTVTDGINKGIPFLILPLLSYYLTPSDYGVIANYGVLLAIVSVFIMMGLDGFIGVNYYRLSKAELSSYLFNAFILIVWAMLVIMLVCLLFSPLLYTYFKLSLSYIMLLIVMAFAMTITSLNLSLWRLEEKPLQFGLYEISQTAANIGISLLLVIVYRLGWVGRVDGMLIASISFGLFSLILLWKRGYLKINFDKNIQLAALSFGLPLIPHALSMWIRSGIDRLFIMNWYGEAATGLYATGFQFGIMISFLIIAFNNAFVPFLYKNLSEPDPFILEDNKRKLKKITWYSILCLFVIAILFYGLSIFILTYFFSDQYLGAQQFVFWAILSQLFQGFYLLFVNYIFYLKKTKSLATITFSCSLLQVVISYFFIKYLGPIGGAYSSVIVSFINFIAVAYYSNKVYRMDWLKIV